MYFLSSNCLWYSFVYLFENCQNSFLWGLPFVHSGPQNTWILEVQAVRSEFCLVRFRNIHIKESKKPRFTFSSSWEPNLSDVMVYVCLFQNAILHKVKARALKFYGHFFSEWMVATFFGLLLVICFSWNLHLKLSHEFLTFISFNIWS